jgi:D-3-phosphoglycerate dehydrogenase
MIIAVPDDYHDRVARLDCLSRLTGHDVRIFRDVAPSTERLVANLRDADVVVPIRERTRFTREIIGRLPRLRLFSQTGRSTHHIDVQACTERGILVAAGRSDSPYTVSEHTWALILASLRRIPEETALMKRGAVRASFSGPLHGRTLGVFGLGRIGRLVAATGASFGMRVLVFGRAGSIAAARAAGYEVAGSRSGLFEQSDVLCVLVRLSPDTRGIVTAGDLARMKPTALFVNTARAALVEPGALVEALRKGRPGFAAVDVYEQEPVVNGAHPLLEMENALCTPHTAWLIPDTYESYFGEAFDNIVAFARGAPANVVNADALAAGKA